jgi:NAD(P)-dependent dehydrogenase (short-subunit alcohol dehydrogenase family)
MSDILSQLSHSAPVQALQARLARVRSLAPVPLSALCSVLALAAWRLVRRRSVRRQQRAAWRDWSAVVAVVTGGASGIGHEVVQQLRARGARVVILDLQAPREPQEGVLFLKTDVTDYDAVQQTKAAVHKHFGPVTILVNNVRVATSCGTVHELITRTGGRGRGRRQLRQRLGGAAAPHRRGEPALLVPHRQDVPARHAHRRQGPRRHDCLGRQLPAGAACHRLQRQQGVSSGTGGFTRAHELTTPQVGVLSFHEGLRQEIALLYRRPGVLTTCVPRRASPFPAAHALPAASCTRAGCARP